MPWKGLQNIDPETDPNVTPGSVPSGPTINTTIQDVNRYLLRDRSGGEIGGTRNVFCDFSLAPCYRSIKQSRIVREDISIRLVAHLKLNCCHQAVCFSFLCSFSYSQRPLCSLPLSSLFFLMGRCCCFPLPRFFSLLFFFLFVCVCLFCCWHRLRLLSHSISE